VPPPSHSLPSLRVLILERVDSSPPLPPPAYRTGERQPLFPRSRVPARMCLPFLVSCSVRSTNALRNLACPDNSVRTAEQKMAPGSMVLMVALFFTTTRKVFSQCQFCLMLIPVPRFTVHQFFFLRNSRIPAANYSFIEMG
jgi:hypothetical protein